MSLMESAVGVTFGKRPLYVRNLVPGQPLLLVREPDNPHDPNAIAIYDTLDNHLGYLPSWLARTLAAFLPPQGRLAARMERKAQAIIRLGSVHTPGSAHEKALSEAARPEGAATRLGGLQLYPHQAEDVICMAAVERMGPWRPFTAEMLTNICGSNTVRLEEPEEYVPPVFFPLTVVVASAANVYSWTEALVTHGGQRVIKVASRAELNSFDVKRDNLPGSCDVVVISRTFVRQLATRLRFMRVSRLILDDALDMGGGRFDIRCCFLWLIDHRVSDFLSHFSSLPSCVRSALAGLSLPSIEDPSPIIISHSQQEVDVSLGLEHPLHSFYHISRAYSCEVAHLPPLSAADCAEQLVVRHHIPIWKKEVAADMVEPGVRERLEAQLESDEGCMVCLEAYTGGGTCLLTCCTRLLCCTCVWKIVHTSGTCPNCRGAMEHKGAAVVMISDCLDNPLNVTHYFCSQMERKFEALSFLLSRIGLGGRVLIWTGCADHWDELTGMDFQDLFEYELNMQLVTFSGSGVQQRSRLIEYQGIGDTAIPDQLIRLSTVLDPHQTARGLNLDATTDLIFYSSPTQEQYDYVMSRVVNARTPGIRRRSGRRLKVHMMAENKAYLPAIRTSQEGIGSGRGVDPGAYELAIAQDLVTF
ncbi:hypothetical protein KFL_006340180 [Klebsormidium nitens]|uniref:RING-type domain-containing protein n=1 Tax=Klebsormidium nitens TaxID=105231 RepID=A0A1Y1IHP6_KLENI|nr:hypothetical protein KFL_006340180 [Klebsormidium nitens]|eukprot:GAQ90400.1 hypothetical protein KFL_006340180 [Klebsormidium nitens]